jgi:hypothetical protein
MNSLCLSCGHDLGEARLVADRVAAVAVYVRACKGDATRLAHLWLVLACMAGGTGDGAGDGNVLP